MGSLHLAGIKSVCSGTAWRSSLEFWKKTASFWSASCFSLERKCIDKGSKEEKERDRLKERKKKERNERKRNERN